VTGLLLAAQGILSSNGPAVTYASSKAIKRGKTANFCAVVTWLETLSVIDYPLRSAPESPLNTEIGCTIRTLKLSSASFPVYYLTLRRQHGGTDNLFK